MLDIHALQVFYEAYKTGSFTAAARKLSMTQPAVSMQIKTLEDYLQVQLFERNGRYMRLTNAGQALVPRAKQLIEMAIGTEETIRAANNEVMGDLVIGCSVHSANSVLIHIVSRFQHLYPNVRISIPTVSQDELFHKLDSGEFDLGVLSVFRRCERIQCTPFFDDQIVLVAPVSHPFAEEYAVAPESLLGQQYVCQDDRSACRYAVADALRPYGIDTGQFDIRMELGSHGAIIAAVEHGIGLSFVSLLEAAPALAHGNLHIIDISGVQMVTTVQLAYSKTQAASLAAMKFKAFVEHPQTVAQIQMLTQGVIAGG